MTRLKIILFFLLVTVILPACVSKKKYTELETLKNRIQGLLDSEGDKNDLLSKQVDSLTALLKDCNEKSANLEKDTMRLYDQYTDLRDRMNEINATCDQLRNNYVQLKSQSSNKIQDLINQLELLQKDLTERERRLAQVEAEIHARDSVMNALRKSLEDALLGFKDQGLTVEVKNGKVYVSLSNKLLFSSGSTKVDAKGKEALKELGKVLTEKKDLTIMVEGHTDDVPVSNLGDIKDNWDLSVMRSTEVVRLIVKEGVESTRIIPSGRSEFIPKAMEKTPEARASNRRTEIIISPKLDELYNLINQKP